MDGFEALEIISTCETLPDLVLLDVMMPRMSGYEVCDRLRGEFHTASLPIIMVSAKADPADAVRGLEHGCNDYISKPFNRLELLARVEAQLRLSQMFQLELDHEKSELLLSNIMPRHIHEQLKSGKTLIADKYESVSILFSDIVNFTTLAHNCDTPKVVQILNELFSGFDRMVDDYAV